MSEERSNGGRRTRRRRTRRDLRSESHDAAFADGGGNRQAVPEREGVPRDDERIVSTKEELEALCDRVRAAGSFAYDTEFIGEESYHPKLCLLQVGTLDEVALVDPIAGLPCEPVWELVADPDIEVLVHAGQQDLEPIVRGLGHPPANLVDTQVAAAFAGLPHPLSLRALLEDTIDVKVGKAFTFTRWDQRPLSPQLAQYAGDDVRYLPAAWRALRPRLESFGTYDAVLEECAAMCDPARFAFDGEQRLRKLMGNRKLRARQVEILRRLLHLRDRVAREQDVPPRSLLKDDVVVRIAREQPGDAKALDRIKGVPWPFAEAHGAEVASIVKDVKDTDHKEIDVPGVVEESPRDQMRVDSLWSAAECLCLARGIAPGMAASRRQVAEWWFAREGRLKDHASPLDRGWRSELVGGPLGRLVEGEDVMHLRWTDGRLESVDGT